MYTHTHKHTHVYICRHTHKLLPCPNGPQDHRQRNKHIYIYYHAPIAKGINTYIYVLPCPNCPTVPSPKE